jgi:hypothetical protein
LMPVLTGAEALAIHQTQRRSHCCHHEDVPAADTGCPETKKEWLARIRHHFVLKGPRERKEGKGTESVNVDVSSSTMIGKQTQTDIIEDSRDDLEDIYADARLPDTSLVAVSGGQDGIDILGVIKNKYHDDSFFKTIISKPKEFQNFKVTKDGLVFLKDQG